MLYSGSRASCSAGPHHHCLHNHARHLIQPAGLMHVSTVSLDAPYDAVQNMVVDALTGEMQQQDGNYVLHLIPLAEQVGFRVGHLTTRNDTAGSQASALDVSQCAYKGAASLAGTGAARAPAHAPKMLQAKQCRRLYSA